MITAMHRIALILSLTAAASAATIDVRAHGAKGDGTTKDTRAIQSAIDAAEKQGGGTVTIPAGRYLSGTIHLQSNVTLHLDNGAVILASRDEADFDPYEQLNFKPPDDRETTYFHYALLAGEKIHDVAITGEGAIDGNRDKRGGPKTIALKLAERVTIRGVTVRNSPNYAISFLGCDNVVVDGVRIFNSYADGIDPDSSRFVRIANSYIDSSDDAICPKASFALGYRRSTEHVTVVNCTTRTRANHFKLGTESEGGFRDIVVSNLTMLSRDPLLDGGRRAKSGISLEMVDGGILERIAISNITMVDPLAAIFIRLGNRGRSMDPPTTGSLRDVSIQNVIATGLTLASSVTGLANARVSNVTLDNLQLEYEGGFAGKLPIVIDEQPAKYPESTMFGELPSWAFYARHADGLDLRNVRVRAKKSDPRPPLVIDDVRLVDGSRLRIY